jgi:hypothetical protein
VSAALYVTIWISLVCFVAAESGKRIAMRRRTLPAWMTPVSALGIALLVAHIALAFHMRYQWSHDVAVRETARQTASTFGLDWGGGVYVNYLFAVVWALDSWWWHTNPPAAAARAAAVRWALRLFYLTIVVNGAVVFVPGPERWLGAALTAWLLWTWRPISLDWRMS